jgi:hypothetical protein
MGRIAGPAERLLAEQPHTAEGASTAFDGSALRGGRTGALRECACK